ncbi:MAG: hypothetical protein QM705_00135 [Ancrocorticia sp.]
MSPDENVQAFLDARGAGLRVIHMDEEVPTVDAAAAALGVQPAQIAKTLAIRAKDRRCWWSREVILASITPNSATNSAANHACSPGPRRKNSRANPSAKSAPSDTPTPRTSTATSRCAASTPPLDRLMR